MLLVHNLSSSSKDKGQMCETLPLPICYPAPAKTFGLPGINA
jgi:hypothetical protein